MRVRRGAGRAPPASLLHGPDRLATVEIATWVRAAILDDGTAPHGILYRSRHAGGDVHAYWLSLDTGQPVGTEILTADTGTLIAARDPDLRDTDTRYGLTVH